MVDVAVLLVLVLVVVSVLTQDRKAQDPVISKESLPRYQYVQNPQGGIIELVDMMVRATDITNATASYNPDQQNIYYFFTRAEPDIGYPVILGSHDYLAQTAFDALRRTIILIHGWLGSLFDGSNAVLIRAFLKADDVNVVVVDWSAGANANYISALANTLPSGESVARFINWLNNAKGATPAQYHIVGHSLGGHQAGIVGRNVNGTIAYITALDPANPGWILNNNRFRADDGAYTEVIHTNTGVLGYVSTLGQVDFYPNRGINMPGCNGQSSCDHMRCYHYMAESLVTGGFTGTQCSSLFNALLGNCNLGSRLQMGGLQPKTGQTGTYYLRTNTAPQFSIN